MTREFTPPVGTVSLAVSCPVWESTTKLEMLFEIEFATSTNRGVVAGGIDAGFLYAPQPTKIMGTIKVRTKCVTFLPDMPVLLVVIMNSRDPLFLYSWSDFDPRDHLVALDSELSS